MKYGKLFQYDLNYNNYIKLKNKESNNIQRIKNNDFDKEFLKLEKNRKKFNIILPELVKIPNEQLIVKNLTFSYNNINTNSEVKLNTINSFDFTVNKGERIALVGPNGSGKSTLLKLIANKLDPNYGEIKLHPNCKLFYYAQQQVDLLGKSFLYFFIYI